MRAGTLRVIVLYSTLQCSVVVHRYQNLSVYYVTRNEVVMSLAFYHLDVTPPSDIERLHGLNQCGREGGYSDGDIAARERSRCQLLLHSKSL